MLLGVTTCVPPFGGRLYVLPSEPLTITCVALVAVTVSVDEAFSLIEVGLAAMFTVGAGDCDTVMVALAVAVPPTPVAVAV